MIALTLMLESCPKASSEPYIAVPAGGGSSNRGTHDYHPSQFASR